MFNSYFDITRGYNFNQEPLSRTTAAVLGVPNRVFPVPNGDWLDAETLGGRKLAASLASKHLAEVVPGLNREEVG